MKTEEIRFGIFWPGNMIMPVEQPLDYVSCEEIQKYLKEKYNRGTYNLDLGFFYKPKDEN